VSTGRGLRAPETLAPAGWQELGQGVRAWVQPDGSWFINNAGLVHDGGRIACIDTCSTERRTRAYLDAVRQATGHEPQVLVNTHHHGDHTNGNFLAGSAVVVGHDRCREEMLRTGIPKLDGVFEPVDWGELRLAPPWVTFRHAMDVWVGDLRVELRHFGLAAHTTNDVVAWLPDRGVLFAGDLVMNGVTPFVLMGSVSGALTALDQIVELGAAVLVPGHGPPGGPEIVDPVGEYLRFVQEVARQGVAAGLSPLEVAREADLGDFAELLDPERIVGNLHRAYAEERGARPGDPIDVMAAFADMVTFNGGRPLRCRA
jgi:cyclase